MCSSKYFQKYKSVKFCILFFELLPFELTRNLIIPSDQTLDPKKTWVLGLDKDPYSKKINLGLDSEFNSIHFGIEISKSLKFFGTKFHKFSVF
jgi:hypothetical protein